jgi:hypothetical protein
MDFSSSSKIYTFSDLALPQLFLPLSSLTMHPNIPRMPKRKSGRLLWRLAHSLSGQSSPLLLPTKLRPPRIRPSPQVRNYIQMNTLQSRDLPLTPTDRRWLGKLTTWLLWRAKTSITFSMRRLWQISKGKTSWRLTCSKSSRRSMRTLRSERIHLSRRRLTFSIRDHRMNGYAHLTEFNWLMSLGVKIEIATITSQEWICWDEQVSCLKHFLISVRGC